MQYSTYFVKMCFYKLFITSVLEVPVKQMSHIIFEASIDVGPPLRNLEYVCPVNTPI